MFDARIFEHVEHPEMHTLLLTRPLTFRVIVGEQSVGGLMTDQRLAKALELTRMVPDAIYAEQVKLAANADLMILTAGISDDAPSSGRQVLGEPQQLPFVRAVLVEDSQDAGAFWASGPSGDADRTAENGRNIKRARHRSGRFFSHLFTRLPDSQLISLLSDC